VKDVEADLEACKSVQYDAGTRELLVRVQSLESRLDELQSKPKPREFWVNIYPHGEVGKVAYELMTAADFAATGDRKQCIKVREVIE